jgi:predicted nucleic acid-binding protein
MSDKIFLDTNVLVYAHSDLDLTKQKKAQEIISTLPTHISTQVLQELANTLSRKFNSSWQQVRQVLDEASKNNVLYINKPETIKEAIQIAERYRYSFYDSLIIAAALETKSSILYSEDLQHKQVIEDALTIVNPFAQGE